MTYPKQDEGKLVQENWDRYEYGRDRGHRDYVRTAEFLEGMYLGGEYEANGQLKPGGHYNDDDLTVLEEERRPAYELNMLKSAVEAALGYQIANRMDIAFRPSSGEATRKVAKVRSQLAMHIAKNNKLHWLETAIFADGLIEQRGFLDIRMNFDDSILGELSVSLLDPRDVIPDPDSKTYHPSGWGDVVVARWLTADEIEALWGPEAKRIAEESGDVDSDHGTDDREHRNHFGTRELYDHQYTRNGVTRYRVIDRQLFIRSKMNVAIYPTGDVRPLNGDETPEVMDDLRAKGATITKRMVKRVHWRVSTCSRMLHYDWSPYDRFTIVPYFPYFRRGKTRGMVDGGVGAQQIVDKAASQMIHIVNTTANSGWQVEENQLTNMTSEDLEQKGASTGLVLERKAGTPPLQKIQPNQVPPGMEKLLEVGMTVLKEVTVPDAMRGTQLAGESGILNQSRQHAAQQILAVPLDNLAQTRVMIAEWFDYAITKYYDTQRTFRITRIDPLTSEEVDEPITINQWVPETGEYLNDMTAGEYDLVITEQPMQVTFENSQFTQIMEMRKEGVRVPDPEVIRASNLTEKQRILESMQSMAAPADPLAEAKAALTQAQATKTQAEAVLKRVEAIFAATTAGQQIASQPAIAPVADQILNSASFQDGDGGKVVEPPTGPAVPAPPPAQNSSPNFPPRPANPTAGANAGIESAQL